MSFQIEGSTFFITGGSSGIGLTVAKQLLSQGAAAIGIVARRQAQLDAAVAELKAAATAAGNGNAIIEAYSADVSDEAAMTAAAASFTARAGHIDVLIASAGVSQPDYFENTPLSEFERNMRINYLGVVASTKAVLPAMRARGRGRLVFISSMAGQAGIFGYSAYAPSKFAVRGFAEVLAMEVKPHGVTVSIANPPDVDTPMYAKEMELKPVECKRMSEGTGVFSADAVATDIVNGIINYKYFIQTGFDGAVLALATAGFAPVESGPVALLQGLSAGVLRLVAVGLVWWYDRIALEEHRKRGGAPTPALATAAATGAAGGAGNAGASESGESTPQAKAKAD